MKAYKGIRRFKHIMFCVPVLLAFGCANLAEIQNLEKIRHALSEDGDYHFRKTRWGYSQAMVELSEQKQGTRLFSRKENTLIYNERIADVPIKIVYSFENDRLRVAGYLTDKPIKNAKQIHEHAAETLGEPRDFISGGSVWADYMTLIYLNGYTSHVTKSNAGFQFGSPGLLPHQKKRDGKAGTITRSDVVWAYVDQNFFRHLHEVEDPVYELTYYEKRLFDVLRRQPMAKCLGFGTFPQ